MTAPFGVNSYIKYLIQQPLAARDSNRQAEALYLARSCRILSLVRTSSTLSRHNDVNPAQSTSLRYEVVLADGMDCEASKDARSCTGRTARV